MQTNDLILGATTGLSWDHLAPWVVSIHKSGFTGNRAMIVYQDDPTLIGNLQQFGFRIFRLPQPQSIYNDRFRDFFTVINQYPDLRYAIVTDSRDVIFQSDPTVWLAANLHKPLLATSEGIAYRNESWNMENLSATLPWAVPMLENETVYNVGVLSGRANAVADLCLAISMTARGTGYYVADQSAYNLLIRRFPYADVVQTAASDAGYACQAGTLADPNKIEGFRPHLLEPEPILTGDGVATGDGVPYAIVHQYDRVPAWHPTLIRMLNR